MTGIVEPLRLYWLAQKTPPAPGVDEKRLRAFERQHQVTLPHALRSYFLAMNGMGTFEGFDDDFFQFWPLDRVRRVSDQYNGYVMDDQDSYFIFADHSILLPAFAIRLTPQATSPHPVVAIIGDHQDYSTSIVARSFTEFIERYLRDDRSRRELGLGLAAESEDEE